MSQYEIAIVGGGLAGATAAAMLGRAGFTTALIDPHDVYPPDFRCEKLDASQVALLRKTGLAEPVLASAVIDDEVWIARFGHLLGKRRHEQFGILYPNFVNTMRAAIPATVDRIASKASAVALSQGEQTVTLADGREISCRLVVMANGLNAALRDALGFRRQIVSAAHSVSIGFDVAPGDRTAFGFRALTYGPERIGDRVAYITFFPVASGMRANLFVYRDMRDPWLKAMRDAPRDTLFATLPNLQRLTGKLDLTSFVQIRPVDLYVTTGVERPGIVLVGDAFATSCPAAGTGVNKVLTDVERLCHAHIPAWLQSEGMGEEKIAAFYADPVKVAADRHSAEKAQRLRALSIDTRLRWKARRLVRGVGTYGSLRLRNALGGLSPSPHVAHPPAPPLAGLDMNLAVTTTGHSPAARKDAHV